MPRLHTRAAVLVLAALLGACGKKGPPLAPIVRIPAAVTMIAAQRVGNEFYLTLTVPTTNIDMTMPVDIGRVDIYGYTGTTAPPGGRFLEVATRVASVPVVPLPTTPGASPEPGATPATAATPAGVAPPVGAMPGSRVTVVDALTPDQLLQGRIVETVTRATGVAPLPPTTAPAQPLRRFYIALGVSTAGRSGPEPTPSNVVMVDPPAAPESLVATTTPQSVVLAWEPNGGLLGFLFGRLLPPESNPAEDVFAEPADPNAAAAVPTGPLRYNVYVKETPVPGVAPSPGAPVPPTAVAGAPPAAGVPWLSNPGIAINPMPLEVTTAADPIAFGRERCYTVRAVRGTPPNVIESAASAPACITPVDMYPPAVPAEVVAVAAEGSISLIWEPGGDPDLAGYLVLRGAPGDATLRPLTPEPITEARYIDTMVTAGTRYVYAIVAVDNVSPTPNRSAESVRVEETAR